MNLEVVAGTGRGTAASADQTMEPVFINDGADGPHFGDLVAKRFRVIALEVLPTLSAVRWLALKNLTNLFKTGPECEHDGGGQVALLVSSPRGEWQVVA